MKNEFLIAIKQLCAEKNLPEEVVYSAIEAALISAYKRSFGTAANQPVSVRINRTTGDVKVYAEKTVVEEVTDPRAEIALEQARRIKPGVKVGDAVEVEATPHDFGRIAAQTAKQVVLQRLREAEREAVYEEFTDKERDIVTGIVQRVEPKRIVVDLGKVEATLPEEEQVPGERYRPGQRIKALLVEVRRTPKGPEVKLSRTHRDLLRRLFELEVPEISQGTVELKAIAREPGSRSKVAVAARQEGVDPVGSCVGMRGIRIQNIVRELNDEKIDVVPWHPDEAVFVGNALSPAQVLHVELNEAEKTAYVVVPDRQLSLAIGKEGQNARLAAKLTGWRIDIKSASAARAEREARRQAEEAAAREAAVAAAASPPAEEVPEVAPEPTPIVEFEPVVEAPTAEVAPTTETGEEVWAAQATETGVPVETEFPVAALEPEPAAVEPERPSWELPTDEMGLEIPLEEFEEPTPMPGQIRFAEDLFDTEGYRLDGKKKKKGKKAEEREREAVARAKKQARRPRLEEEEEDLGEYEEYLRHPGGRR